MMNRELLQRVLAEKRALRTHNESIEVQRLEEICTLSPEIAKLIEARRQTFFLGLRSALNGVVPQTIERDTLQFNERIKSLLTEFGYRDDYLSPIFTCALCEDSGYIGDGKKTFCSCVMLRYQDLLSGETFLNETQTFENYNERFVPNNPITINGAKTTQRSYTRTLRNDCETYANNLTTSPILNLLLHGSSGLGKTYLLRSIGVRATQKGIQTLSLSANTLLNRIRAEYFARNGDTPDNTHYSVPLLLIDDLGTEPLWEGITVEQLFSLVEYRLNHKLYTVVSTNLSLSELKARYTERFISRFLDERQSCVLSFLGTDLRNIKY